MAEKTSNAMVIKKCYWDGPGLNPEHGARLLPSFPTKGACGLARTLRGP